MRTLFRQELQDIVVGGGLFGAGGGGSTAEGMKLVERVLQFAPGVKLATLEEIPDDAWGAAVAGMGSPKASLTRIRAYSPPRPSASWRRRSASPAGSSLPSKPGAGNSINPMLAAVQKDIPMVDGDPVGRAVPELQITLFFLAGIPLSRSP